MDAKELTKKVYELENIIYDLRKRVELLEDSNSKLKMHVDDLKIDVRGLEYQRRCNNG